MHLSLLGDRNDPRVGDAVREVNRARLELLARTYREPGLPPDRATSRARVAYAAILGLMHLAQTDPDAPNSALLAEEATRDLPTVLAAHVVADPHWAPGVRWSLTWRSVSVNPSER